MSAVIKSSGAGASGLVRPHRMRSVDALPLELPDEETLLQARIAQLEAELVRQAEVARQQEKHSSLAREQARAEGYRKGLEDAARKEAERLETLKSCAKSAVKAFEGSLSEAETLAVLLARTCLETLFGTAKGRVQTVCDLIRRQLETMTGETVVMLKVSREDFPDEKAVAALLADSGLDRARVEVDSALKPGAASLQLGLGQMELGIDRQWGSLRQLLDDWTSVGVGA